MRNPKLSKVTAYCTAMVLSLFMVIPPTLAEAVPDTEDLILNPRDLEVPRAVTDGRWLGADGTLPFSTHEEIQDFLLTAEVVKIKRLSEGVNRSSKVTLEQDGIRAHAVFRSAEIERPAPLGESRVNRNVFRDSYIFEVAAYELNTFLGLDQVPPAVLRTVSGQRGSLQLWIEQARTESSRIKSRQTPPDPSKWNVQKQVMRVFDNLIYNFDRNPGNMLFDANGKLWYIDHTRSFKRLPILADTEALVICDREFFNRLRGFSDEAIKVHLRPYLEMTEINAVLERREQLVEMFTTFIAERGEDSVLFDLQSRIDPSRATEAPTTDRRASLLDSGVWPVL